MKKHFFALACVLLTGQFSQAKPDSTSQKKITLSAFSDIYYSYDLNSPASGERPFFTYNHKKANEITANLLLGKASFTDEKVRANLGLMAGTYVQHNYATEPSAIRHIYDANAGVRLAKGLWLDAGIFGSSHIGFESAVSKDNWTLTRSMCAENTPYYSSGAALTYSESSPWSFSLWVLNGWQVINEPKGNSWKALGTKITYTGDKLTLNHSTFWGNEKTDANPQFRYLSDLYAIYHLTDKTGVIAGIDVGMEETPKRQGYNNWINPTFIVRQLISDKLALALRGEYYRDPNGVIIATGTKNGFDTFGTSLNLDYQINSHALFRIEGKLYQSKDPVFETGSKKLSQNNTAITTSLAVNF